MLSHIGLINKILLKDSIQQNFVLMKDVVMEMRFLLKYLLSYKSVEKEVQGKYLMESSTQNFMKPLIFFSFLKRPLILAFINLYLGKKSKV